ncbi:hypothetical protein CsSME_00024808 [Camellia sinensis var. sinensis]
MGQKWLSRFLRETISREVVNSWLKLKCLAAFITETWSS